MGFLVNISEVLGTAWINLIEENLKRESGKIVLVSFTYKSLKTGQLPQQHLFFLQNLLTFLSQYIWNKKSVTVSAFAWTNVAPVVPLYLEI